MAEKQPTTFDDFYREIASETTDNAHSAANGGAAGTIGRFGVFDLEELHRGGEPLRMPYNRRTYYKISLIRGRNRAEYADRVINVERNALLFATPNIPYHWLPQDDRPRGVFCVFTREFLAANATGTLLDKLPIFTPGGTPLFEISDEQAAGAAAIFRKMQAESTSDYAYRYDLLRTYVLELVHMGQKLQPAAPEPRPQNAATRIIGLFRELLERQFTPLSPAEPLQLRTARDYAARLALHVNYLNQVLKTQTGKTTTQLISERMVQEAKVLLKHSHLSVSEIAHTLGFEEVAHFSNFFKRHTEVAPQAFRG